MYTREQLLKVWNAVNYRQHRYWAFMISDGSWRHTDSQFSKKSTFKSFDEFEAHVKYLNARDIHVKKTVTDDREWVIDVDHDEKDRNKIELKNMIAHATFGKFFGSKCAKIMFSGNRGLHIWLSHDVFPMDASKETRQYYYNCVLTKPSRLNVKLLKEGSMAHCFYAALQNKWVKRKIAELYPNINQDNFNLLLKEFYPCVDKQVFESNKQIRAPYSFNSKGNQYNCDHQLVTE